MPNLVAAYEINGKAYSAYQQNTVIEDDGTIRYKTFTESQQVAAEVKAGIDKAIADGRAYRKRTGETIWTERLS